MTARLKVHKDSFIPVPLHVLQEHCEHLLSGEGPTSREQFARAAQLIENIYHSRAQELRSLMSRDWVVIARHSGRGQRLKVVQSAREVKEDSTEQMDRFFSYFMKIMQKANYTLVTQKEWDLANEEAFNFDVDISVNWSKMDTSVLGRYLDNNRALKANAYEHASHCFVFHRGMGMAEQTGRFIPEKLNLLVGYVLGCKKRAQDDVGERKKDDDKENDENMTYVERRTLSYVLPNFMSVIKSLVQKTTIFEPVFQDVVVVYFDKVDCDDKAKQSSAIQIKSFHSIPMADMEVTMPWKTISIPPIEKLKLAIAVVVAIIGLITMIQSKLKPKDGVPQSFGLLVIISMGMLALKIFQMYSNLQTMKQRALSKMTEDLYIKSMDSGMGVVNDTIDSMEHQETKEATLAYWAMLQEGGGPKTESQVDGLAERLLVEEFNLTHINFESDDGINKLITDGLASKLGHSNDHLVETQYEPVEVAEAISRLARIWQAVVQEESVASEASPTSKKPSTVLRKASFFWKTKSISPRE